MGKKKFLLFFCILPFVLLSADFLITIDRMETFGYIHRNIDFKQSGQMEDGETNISFASKQSNETDRFTEAIRKYSLHDVIVISSFDASYAPMALNLYLTSFKKFNIRNHLFLATDAEGCDKIKPFGANCVQYSNITGVGEPSVYNTLEYNIKACAKPRMVLDCLKRGFGVLLVDLDVVFLKDPLPFIQRFNEYDFVPQYDARTEEINSGFFFVKNSNEGIRLFENIVQMIPMRPSGDQLYVNEAVKDFNQTIKVFYLPGNLFQLGYTFFTEGHRVFVGDNPCDECIIVHNNYIITLEAKIYRFKEYGLWAVDEGGYYSDRDRKYIKYGNPIQFREHSRSNGTAIKELESLRAALIIGQILNRTVILPTFTCHGVRGYAALPDQRCHFGMHYSVRRFELNLPVLQTYRESVFLQHPLVPEDTKKSISPPFLIDAPIWREMRSPMQDLPSETILRKPERSRVTAAEIKAWFANESAHILVFHALYNEFDAEDKEIAKFITLMDKAILRSNVAQRQQ